MTEKVLIVDDEANILSAASRILRGNFEIHTAQGGRKALLDLEDNGPFAVIVSDMRMPGMDGVQLLNEFSRLAPDTVRIMLTGCTDRQTAIDAVNKGNIFRFLTKPCPDDALKNAIEEGLEQYILVTGKTAAYGQSLENLMSVEERLQEQQNLIDKLSDALFVLDADMRLSKWNVSMEALSGLSGEELLGRKFSSFIIESERTSVVTAIRELFESEAGRVKTHWIGGNGQAVPVFLSTTILKDETGIVVGFVGSVSDIKEYSGGED